MLIAVRNLVRRPRRTLLTIAGVALGAATYMILVTAGNGLLDQFQESAKVLGAEVVVQQQGVTSPWNSEIEAGVLEQLAGMPDVAAVSPMVLGKTRFLGASYFLTFGVDADDPILDNLTLVEGRGLAPDASSLEMLMGLRAAERFELAAGNAVEARKLRFDVAGVYQTGRALLDHGAILDLGVARDLFNISGGANLIFLDLAVRERTASVVDRINAEFAAVEAYPTSEWVESYGQVAVIRIFARFLALVALVIAVLGVSNVLHITVSERTGELAILRAVGWSRWRVASLVLAEGALLCVLGGLAGIPLGMAVLRLVGSVDFGGYTTSGLIPMSLSAAAALEGVFVCAAAGFAGSLAPLWRALRLDPARALRSL
jgi:putative ABC transport system permease protein